MASPRTHCMHASNHARNQLRAHGHTHARKKESSHASKQSRTHVPTHAPKKKAITHAPTHRYVIQLTLPGFSVVNHIKYLRLCAECSWTLSMCGCLWYSGRDTCLSLLRPEFDSGCSYQIKIPSWSHVRRVLPVWLYQTPPQVFSGYSSFLLYKHWINEGWPLLDL